MMIYASVARSYKTAVVEASPAVRFPVYDWDTYMNTYLTMIS